MPNKKTISDDTIIMKLLETGDCPLIYLKAIDAFQLWCKAHNFILIQTKTREMVFAPRNLHHHDPVNYWQESDWTCTIF